MPNEKVDVVEAGRRLAIVVFGALGSFLSIFIGLALARTFMGF